MKIIKKLKNLVLQTDFFYSTEMLRYNADLQYKTFTGGIISLGIIITIIVGFASMILNTLNLSSISTSTEVIKNLDPPSSTILINDDSPFRFGVEIWHLNLSDTKRYFDVTLQNWYWQNGNLINATTVPLQTCTKQYFKNYAQILNSFDELETGKWLCPPLNTTMQIYGKYSSKKYSEYVTVVSACNNATNPAQPCASPQQIQNYMDLNQNYIYFTVYFTNTQINPDKKNYKQYYIEDQSYTILGSNIGTESYLYFTDYTVSTDYSIWPFSSQVDDKGVVVQNLAVNHPFQTNINNVFVYFSFVKGPDSIIYSREVQKLSAVFSFMGGMIGAVSAVLFFVKVYTSLSYQFSIAFEIFRPSQDKGEDEQPAQTMSFNFLNFIRYYFFVFLKKIGFKCQWPPLLKYARECRTQILQQLDVKALIKRIIFIEHCLNYMIEDYQLDALQIKKPTNPHQIKKIRRKFESIIENDINISQFPSEFLSDYKLEVMECNDQIIEDTPSNLRKVNAKRKTDRVISFKFQNIKASSESQSKSEQPKSQRDSDIVVIDINHIRQATMKSQQKELNEDSRRQAKPKKRNRIQNDYEYQKKRSTYLSKLKKNAEDGNEISNKILKHLNLKFKDDLTQFKK